MNISGCFNIYLSIFSLKKKSKKTKIKSRAVEKEKTNKQKIHTQKGGKAVVNSCGNDLITINSLKHWPDKCLFNLLISSDKITTQGSTAATEWFFYLFIETSEKIIVMEIKIHVFWVATEYYQ